MSDYPQESARENKAHNIILISAILALCLSVGGSLLLHKYFSVQWSYNAPYSKFILPQNSNSQTGYPSSYGLAESQATKTNPYFDSETSYKSLSQTLLDEIQKNMQ